jgi:hypothetical protein
MRKSNEFIYTYNFLIIGHRYPPANVWIFVSYKGVNKCVSPDFITVDIVTQFNSTSSDISPLSLQLLEEVSNKY